MHKYNPVDLHEKSENADLDESSILSFLFFYCFLNTHKTNNLEIK